MLWPCLSSTPPVTGRTNDPGQSGVDGLHCSTGAGVTGISRGGDGIVGIGVNGVVGESNTGHGVYARSEQGVGLLARGGSLAARFEGNVVVTGSLTVQGVDLGDLLQVDLGALLQRVSSLEQRVAQLESQLNAVGQVVDGLLGSVSALQALAHSH